ncbi:hypothetical protein, partial [Paenibacillus cisolokensis]|uniref:hypothetical protein n=1 Tax=Paenibacillus cisolokensis TaxID=1658519 RepID=UPI001BD18A95
KIQYFWKLSLIWLERIKKTALSQQFSHFGYFPPENAALLQLCAFIGFLCRDWCQFTAGMVRTNKGRSVTFSTWLLPVFIAIIERQFAILLNITIT